MTPLSNPGKPVKVLMVEDNHADVFLMKELLKDFVFPVNMCVVHDGEEALTVLRHSLCFSAKQDPDFILLDLNLPKMDGHEVLAEIKGDPGLKHIPILVLTSSTNERDRTAAYENNAAGYLLKPDELDHYASLVKSIEDFWIKTSFKRPRPQTG